LWNWRSRRIALLAIVVDIIKKIGILNWMWKLAHTRRHFKYCHIVDKTAKYWKNRI